MGVRQNDIVAQSRKRLGSSSEVREVNDSYCFPEDEAQNFPPQKAASAVGLNDRGTLKPNGILFVQQQNGNQIRHVAKKTDQRLVNRQVNQVGHRYLSKRKEKQVHLVQEKPYLVDLHLLA